MNKKLIYLSIFFIVAVFLISACNEVVGKKPRPVEKIEGIHAGDVININDKSLKLINVGSYGNVIVSFGKIEEVISKGYSKELNCITVRNEDSLYADQVKDRKALLRIYYNNNRTC